MNVPVEAQSISALTNLLANPPQYPRNPTHEVREPLVLYIVRVPGSKDVFLTPLKPPTKASISLEAIQSSLYYLHVASEEDEEVKKSIDEQRRSTEIERVNPVIHRKPLPPTPHANYPPSDRPHPPPKSYPSYQPGLDGNLQASQSERYAARGSHLRFNSESSTSNSNDQRHTASTRRFRERPHSEVSNSELESVPETLQDSLDYQQIRSPPQFPHQARQVSPNSSLPVPDQHHHGPHGYFDHEPAGSHLKNSRAEGTAAVRKSPQVFITLIRRDPCSGGQWNVGNISLNATHVSNAPLDPVSITIDTPGYNRFTSMPDLPRLGSRFADANSIKSAIAEGRLAHPEGSGEQATHHTFSRKAEYQQMQIPARPFGLRHRRSDSSDSITKPPSPTKQQTRQVYSFLSPWQGLCTFSNGIDGRSLKCRHSLSASNTLEEETVVIAAELRFNLAWSVLTPGGGGEKGPEGETLPISQLLAARPGKEKLKKGIQHLRNFSKDLRERKSSSDEELVIPQERPLPPKTQSEVDRLSLRLGREKAGGGFMGSSAKLGKLIIEDEGLKMCDLVVAACMGVWWQHYEG